jgi:WhiB family redox-sensing transcriptional regulator
MEQIGNWRRHGACFGLDLALFFPERGISADAAQAVCADCSVKEPCLEWGLYHEKEGIWGGTSAHQRKVMRRQRGIRVDNGNDFGGPGGEAPGHGTDAGYERHRVASEPACAPCKQAHAQRPRRRTVAA